MKEERRNSLGILYYNATLLAQGNNQTVGEKGDYYITLEQLEALIKKQIEP